MKNSDYHEPVMTREVLDFLDFAHLNSQARIIDATLGHGGHSIELCKKGVQVLGIDADEEALEVAQKRLEKACPAHLNSKVGTFKLIKGNFRRIDEIAKENGFSSVNGVLFDLGVNTSQLTSGERGMSFGSPEATLDMRFDKSAQGVTAADLLNFLNEGQLIALFEKTLDFNGARKLAKEVIAKRSIKPFEKVGEFLSVTEKLPKGKLHPATKAFLALRMAVNSELENLEEALPKAFSVLKEGGRLIVISFHSGEDRIVKNFFKGMEKAGEGESLTPKPVEVSEEEIEKNPKSRSAKLRAFEKRKNEKKEN